MLYEFSDCKHFWDLHRIFARQLWDSLSVSSREIIANDVDHSSEMFKYFEASVMSETRQVFLNEEHKLNNPDRFKRSRY
jgi:hypothetical protein